MRKLLMILWVIFPLSSFGGNSSGIQLDPFSEPFRQYFHSCNGQIEACKNAAAQGNSFAQRKLADAYYEGDGIRQDFSSAFQWYSKAAEQNDSVSFFRLSNFYSDGLSPVKQNDEMALYYQLTAGFIEDQNFTPYIEVRDYINKDREFSYHLPSVHYFTDLSNKNDLIAQFVLAEMYLNGKGTLYNPFIAKELFGKSCDRGFQAACKEYKYLNENGI